MAGIGFDVGWAFSERHMPAVRDAIGSIPTRIFLDVATAPVERDQHEATDLVLRVSGGDVAVRIRKRAALWDCPEWSVRVRSRGGHKTELDKLLGGFCRWYFFGYGDGHDGLFAWWLLDLDVVRSAGVLAETWPRHTNHDGSVGMYIPLSSLAALECIVFDGPNAIAV